MGQKEHSLLEERETDCVCGRATTFEVKEGDRELICTRLRINGWKWGEEKEKVREGQGKWQKESKEKIQPTLLVAGWQCQLMQACQRSGALSQHHAALVPPFTTYPSHRQLPIPATDSIHCQAQPVHWQPCSLTAQPKKDLKSMEDALSGQIIFLLLIPMLTSCTKPYRLVVRSLLMRLTAHLLLIGGSLSGRSLLCGKYSIWVINNEIEILMLAVF